MPPLAALLLSACCIASPDLQAVPEPSEPVVLAYRFVDGQPASFDLSREMTSIQYAYGARATVESRTNSRTRTELVERNKDGSLLIANTIDSIRFSAKNEAEEISFDTENPDDQAKTQDSNIASVALMKGVRVLLHLGLDGAILGVPNADELRAAADAMEDPAMAGIARQIWTPEAITALYEGNLKLLPTEPVRPGDTWVHTVELPFGQSVILMSLNLTLKGVEEQDGRSFADIGVTGSMTSRTVENARFVMELSTSDISGQVRFDIADGVIDFFRLDTSFTLRIKQADQPDSFGWASVDQKVTQTRVKD